MCRELHVNARYKGRRNQEAEIRRTRKGTERSSDGYKDQEKGGEN